MRNNNMAGRDCTKFMEHRRIVRIIYGNGNTLENIFENDYLNKGVRTGVAIILPTKFFFNQS